MILPTSASSPLTIPISAEGNAVIYGAARGGKSTFITTMLYGLLQAHDARSLHIYLLDFGSETLRAFAKAPQVGDVLFSYDGEKLQNLFKMLGEELERRKRLCAEFGGDLESYNRSSGKTLPYVLTVIQNYAGFCESYEELESRAALLFREGSKYGILFVITALNTNAVRYRTLQNFSQIFMLQMNDDSEYSGVLGSTEGVIPAHGKGRGLVKLDRVYEFQTASVAEDPVPAIRSFCASLAEQDKGPRAPRVPILPERVTPAFVQDAIDSENLRYPVGVVKDSLAMAYLSLKSRPIHYVLSQSGCPDFMRAMAQVASLGEGVEITVLDGDSSAGVSGSVKYCSGAEASEPGRSGAVWGTCISHNTAKEIRESGGTPPVLYAQTVYCKRCQHRI